MAPKQISIPIIPNSFRDGIIFFDLPNIASTKVSELMHLADEAIEEKIIKGEIFGPANKLCITGVEFVLRKQEEYSKYIKKHKKLNPADILMKDILPFDPFITYTINCEPCVMKKDRYQWEKLFHEHYETNIVGPMRKELTRLRQELSRLKPISFVDEIEERDRVFDSELIARSELFKKELRSRQELYEKELEARDTYIRSLQEQHAEQLEKLQNYQLSQQQKLSQKHQPQHLNNNIDTKKGTFSKILESTENNNQFPKRTKFQEDSSSPYENAKTFSDRVRDGSTLISPKENNHSSKEQIDEKKELIPPSFHGEDTFDNHEINGISKKSSRRGTKQDQQET